MTFVLYFLAVWLGGALLLGTPLGLLFGWIGASIARVRDRAPVSSTSMSELPPIKRIARSGITLGQAIGVGVATGWWWALGPDLDPPWLAAPLTLTALFTTNAPGFVRFARSYGAAIEGLWQVLPGVAAAWIVHKLLS